MDFKETQSSVDGKQANYDNEVVVVFEVGHLQSVFPTFAPTPTILLPQKLSCWCAAPECMQVNYRYAIVLGEVDNSASDNLYLLDSQRGQI